MKSSVSVRVFVLFVMEALVCLFDPGGFFAGDEKAGVKCGSFTWPFSTSRVFLSHS